MITMPILDNLAETNLHEESLLQIPLVKMVLADGAFQLKRRAIDANWSYSKRIPVTLSGFNPFEGSYFYAQRSAFANWLKNPNSSARDYNENDCLSREVMFMVHDYLHAWAYQLVDHLWPELGLFSGQIRSEHFEDFVFVHLLSEAVATVGLDYWYLCVRGINTYCPIGSMVGTLTVSYRENLLPEYRKFDSGLVVQDPAFFNRLACFYCHGIWTGIDAADLKRSPLLYKWLEHELSYGATQRSVTRSWLGFLQGCNLPNDASPVQAHAMHAELIDKVGQSLWRLIKDGVNDLKAAPWKRGTPGNTQRYTPDFRFINVVRADQFLLNQEGWEAGEGFRYFVYQVLSRIPYTDFPNRKASYIPWLTEQRDPELVLDIIRGHDLLEAEDEPLNLLVLN